ncbi:MAG: ribosome-associated translation inhibitor RaiA [Alphaproteobacteria bacterium]|nr:ribosome-associated translation inhibitor RaiA [Alphaproteobacteria bacterium]
MQITVTGQQIDVGEALRLHIEDAIEATTDKYFSDAIDATVVISRESFRIRATISMHVGRGIHVRAHEEADEAYAAFDVALAHLAKRLRRNKRRLRDHHNRDVQSAPANAPEYILAPQNEEDETSDGTMAPDNPIIIAENQTTIESLTVSEAVMRLDLADTSAFVFRNAKHSGLSVVYRRNDGNIGWIDTPETEA